MVIPMVTSFFLNIYGNKYCISYIQFHRRLASPRYSVCPALEPFFELSGTIRALFAGIGENRGFSMRSVIPSGQTCRAAGGRIARVCGQPVPFSVGSLETRISGG